MAVLLDSLPPEILLEVASRLDWRSLLSLDRVSARCRDAVTLQLERLRVLRLTEDNDSDVDLGALRELLPRLTALRELHVSPWKVRTAQQVVDVMEALVAASRRWLQLERLTIGSPVWILFLSNCGQLCRTQLVQLCANCPLLTDVKLYDEIDDEFVEAILAAVPGLRALHVSGIDGKWYEKTESQGTWLARLPAELRRLTINGCSLNSAALVQLARFAELHSLELEVSDLLRPEHLAAGLAGCTRLERLRLTVRDVSVSDCLPSNGLTALRHLHLTDCRLTDTDLRRVLERLPGLESVRLEHCYSATPSGLALLGRLPALSSLSLVGTDGVSDWVLDRLSAAPLEELQLGDRRMAFRRDVTPEGLLRLTKSCRTLRTLMLWNNDELVERVSCGPVVEEQHLLRCLQAGKLKMRELDLSGEMAAIRLL